MITVKRSSLRIASICLGLIFLASIYYFFHYRLPWDWGAPGTGKLPQEIIRAYMSEAYEQGRGARAIQDYFADDAADNVSQTREREDGVAIPHEVLSVVAQGQTVVVVHRVGAARGEPAADVIDVFETKRGRIVRRDRYVTSFNRRGE
jgi:hypothetical protein